MQETVAGYPAVVLAKEAVYDAVCVGAFELHDYIDFSSWFRTAMLAVRGLQHPLTPDEGKQWLNAYKPKHLGPGTLHVTVLLFCNTLYNSVVVMLVLHAAA